MRTRASRRQRAAGTNATSSAISASWAPSSCRSGIPRSAAEHLERAAAVAQSAGFVEPNWLRFHGDLIEAMIDLDRVEEASALVDELELRGR